MMNASANGSTLSSMPNLEGWWSKFEASLKARGMLLYPAPHLSLKGALDWPEDRTVEEFLSLAESLGVRLIYATAITFDETAAEEVGGEGARQYLGRLVQVDLWWVHQGIRHSSSLLADWYAPMAKRFVEEQRVAREEKAATRQAQEAAIPEMAATLARNPAFGPARGGFDGRRRVAQTAFPDLQTHVLQQVMNDAWVIYTNQIVPEQERHLAQKAEELLAEGTSLTEAARRLGMSRDRLGRAIAANEKSDSAG